MDFDIKSQVTTKNNFVFCFLFNEYDKRIRRFWCVLFCFCFVLTVHCIDSSWTTQRNSRRFVLLWIFSCIFFTVITFAWFRFFVFLFCLLNFPLLFQGRGRKQWSGQRRKYRWAPKTALPLIPGITWCIVFIYLFFFFFFCFCFRFAKTHWSRGVDCWADGSAGDARSNRGNYAETRLIESRNGLRRTRTVFENFSIRFCRVKTFSFLFVLFSSPSPEPIYDPVSGHRTNTRDLRIREKLSIERQYLVQDAQKICPVKTEFNFVFHIHIHIHKHVLFFVHTYTHVKIITQVFRPPPDYRPISLKKYRKIAIPLDKVTFRFVFFIESIQLNWSL